TGDMTFNLDGTYTSGLTVNRRYTFVPTDSSQPTRVADSTTERDLSGNLIFPAIVLSGTGTWSAPSAASAAPAHQPQSVGPAVAAASPKKRLLKTGGGAAVEGPPGLLPAPGSPT